MIESMQPKERMPGELFSNQPLYDKFGKAVEVVGEAFDRAMHYNRKKKMALSEAFKHEYQGTRDLPPALARKIGIAAAGIDTVGSQLTMKLADPTVNTPPGSNTVLGQVATAISDIISQMPMTMPDTNPLTRNISADFQEAMSDGSAFGSVYYEYRFAQAGMAQGALMGAQPSPTNTTSRGFVTAKTGFFGSRITLDQTELLWWRKTGQIDGFYATEAITRAIGQIGINMQQRKNHLLVRSPAENEYTYYDNPDVPSSTVIMSWGRLDENTFTPTVPWATTPGANPWSPYTPNPLAKPIQDLQTLFTAANPIILSTRPHLVGLIANPITWSMMSLIVQNGNNAASAAGMTNAFKGDWSASDVTYLNVPALAGIPVYTCSDHINLAVNQNYGNVSQVEYYIPDGIIMPIFDMGIGGGIGNGIILYTPDPRATMLMNSTRMPSGIMPEARGSDQATYMRIISSVEVPTTESPFVSVEMGARFSFLNPVAAGTSYILKVFDAA